MAGAPWGSASILPITWAYLRLMGPDGLTAATTTAILSANYIAARLADHYPVLYTGERGLVAHECILDLRGITKQTGVTVDDVAKRLIDYGFHAPTMSFPVAGTLMVEPTESEDLAEIDRFIEAMIAIRGEIDQVAAGDWPVTDNPLRNAPHTARCLVGDWDQPYSRAEAVYPAGVDPSAEVLGAGPPDRRGLRRPQPDVLLPAGGRLPVELPLAYRISGRPASPRPVGGPIGEGWISGSAGDPVQRGCGQVGPAGLDAVAVRQDLAAVLEQHDTVAEQAPALLRVADQYVRGVPVRAISGGAGRHVHAGGPRIYSTGDGAAGFVDFVLGLAHCFSYD